MFSFLPFGWYLWLIGPSTTWVISKDAFQYLATALINESYDGV